MKFKELKKEKVIKAPPKIGIIMNLKPLLKECNQPSAMPLPESINKDKDIIDLGLQFSTNKFSKISISITSFSAKANRALIQQLNGLLFVIRRRDDLKFDDNGAVSEIDLWTNGIHLMGSDKRIIVNNLMMVYILF